MDFTEVTPAVMSFCLVDSSILTDFANGWEPGVLQRAVDECHCNPYGDPSCCVAQGIFSFQQDEHCYVTDTVVENSTHFSLCMIGTQLKFSIAKGLLDRLPGENPVQAPCYEEYPVTSTPAIISPTYVYTLLSESPTSFVSIISPAEATEAAVSPRGDCIRRGGAGNLQSPFGLSVLLLMLLLILLE